MLMGGRKQKFKGLKENRFAESGNETKTPKAYRTRCMWKTAIEEEYTKKENTPEKNSE